MLINSVYKTENSTLGLHPNRLQLVGTKAKRLQLNNEELMTIITQGNAHFRFAASHKPTRLGNPLPSKSVRDTLLKLQDEKYPPFLHLAIGQIVKFTANIGTQIGIYNAARGRIVAFAFSKAGPMMVAPPSTVSTSASSLLSHTTTFFPDDDNEKALVFIQIEGASADSPCGTVLPSHHGVIPVAMQQSKCTFGNKKYRRFQFPLEPQNWGTVHGNQGANAYNGLVYEPSPKQPFAMGMDYVGISRATSIQSLHLLSPIKAYHFTSHPMQRFRIAQEYRRLRSLLTDDERELVLPHVLEPPGFTAH